jgi:hypothetical protein
MQNKMNFTYDDAVVNNTKSPHLQFFKLKIVNEVILPNNSTYHPSLYIKKMYKVWKKKSIAITG